VAVGALGIGLVMGSNRESDSERTSRAFARAWDRQDYRTMHGLLDADSRKRYPLGAFRKTYEDAAATATATNLRVGAPTGLKDGAVRMPVVVSTRAFGQVRGVTSLPVDETGVSWGPHLSFPGVQEGQRLTRRTEIPRRAAIVSADDKVMAEGPADARTSPVGDVGSSIAGTVEPTDDKGEQNALFARGFARDTPVGRSGLERALQIQVEGFAGGTLLAGRTVLARAKPRPAARVRSTIDTRLQEAAVSALAGQLGGIAALDPRTGEVRALAGVAFSAPQPPGSTFKVITTAAALEQNKVKVGDKFPVETKAVIDGVDLENANGESCGGTFAESFAHSCNSVFAPLGVKVGAKELVSMAERFGWNRQPSLAGAQQSTIPEAADIKSPLDLGSSAIGQGRVLATPLEMASVAQTVANDGKRVDPTLIPNSRPVAKRVISRQVADTLEGLMLGVVRYGTGTSAAIPGVQVAGKTGTAELGDTRGPDSIEQSDPSNTDAWFTAFAPAKRPKIAVGVLFVRNGAGGATAAPAARIVLGRALGK
jgi:cell division protein FtsI/penicillin-binding protein 2